VRLAGRLRRSLGVVSYHVKILEAAGLIVHHHDTAVRGAIEHFYRRISIEEVVRNAGLE
jgi:predicted transcriptional regulator